LHILVEVREICKLLQQVSGFSTYSPPCSFSSTPKRTSDPILLEALLGRFPVDDVPDGIEILGFAVFVLKAERDGSTTSRSIQKMRTSKKGFDLLVCMLPGINA
jgi:hypothetical protein